MGAEIIDDAFWGQLLEGYDFSSYHGISCLVQPLDTGKAVIYRMVLKLGFLCVRVKILFQSTEPHDAYDVGFR